MWANLDGFVPVVLRLFTPAERSASRTDVAQSFDLTIASASVSLRRKRAHISWVNLQDFLIHGNAHAQHLMTLFLRQITLDAL